MAPRKKKAGKSGGAVVTRGGKAASGVARTVTATPVQNTKISKRGGRGGGNGGAQGGKKGPARMPKGWVAIEEDSEEESEEEPEEVNPDLLLATTLSQGGVSTRRSRAKQQALTPLEMQMQEEAKVDKVEIPSESGESGAGTPQSCNTPVEFNPKSEGGVILHKKFRKFRNLLDKEAGETKIEQNPNIELRTVLVVEEDCASQESLATLEFGEAVEEIFGQTASEVSNDMQQGEMEVPLENDPVFENMPVELMENISEQEVESGIEKGIEGTVESVLEQIEETELEPEEEFITEHLDETVSEDVIGSILEEIVEPVLEEVVEAISEEYLEDTSEETLESAQEECSETGPEFEILIDDESKSMDISEGATIVDETETLNETEISTQLSALTVNSTEIIESQENGESTPTLEVFMPQDMEVIETTDENIKESKLAVPETVSSNLEEEKGISTQELAESIAAIENVNENIPPQVETIIEGSMTDKQISMSNVDQIIEEVSKAEEPLKIENVENVEEILKVEESVKIIESVKVEESVTNKVEETNSPKVEESITPKSEETSKSKTPKSASKLRSKSQETQSRSSHTKLGKVPTKAQLKSMDIPPKRSSKSPKKEKKSKKERHSHSPAISDKKEKEEEDSKVRRSSRIQSISVLKKSSKGRGLVKLKNQEIDPKSMKFKTNPTDSDATSENSNSSHMDVEKVPLPLDSPSFVAPNGDPDAKPVKVKSRWRRSSELEMGGTSPNYSGGGKNSPQTIMESNEETSSQTSGGKSSPSAPLFDEQMEQRLKQFVHLKENQYLTERMCCKEAKKMICDCFLTEDEIDRGEYGCGEDCLNRLLMIECGNYCVVSERCTNKRFQKMQYSPCEVFRTEKKGCGIRATANIPYGEFVLEYVGEVLDSEEFEKRVQNYSEVNNQHYYFMALRADTVIDATRKGNISRFINHSCEPNAETQKWTVNGELRIGFFSTRTILAGEEITFDYQFQRYGKEAQKCYCEAATCRGWIGEEPDDEEDEEEDEEEPEEEEEEVEEETEEKVQDEKGVVPDVDIAKKPPPPPKKKVVPKRKPIRIRKPRKERFDDADLGEEIEMLCTTGLKNQAHTLKLSRLMVRAKEPTQRMQLLRLIRHGEFPCRRLFLDYHGLRLMHAWMGDIPHMPKTDQLDEAFCLEMLQTLAVLPIPNKTMLQDSKVLHTVEKWSVLDKKPAESPSDSSSNSPNIDPIVKDNKSVAEKVVIAESNIGAKNTETNETIGGPVVILDAEVVAEGEPKVESMEIEVKTEEFVEVKEEVKIEKPKKDYQGDIVHLAIKLLEEWVMLKEVFRIPKKERIEQMKEHEREADRGYKAGLGLEQDALNERKSSRYRALDVRKIEKTDSDRYNRKGMKIDDRNSYLMMPRINKYERRKMFQMQVEQQEADRRRKQQEMWRQHEQNCMMMGMDPRFTAPYDPNRGYQCFWNPQTGQWQNFTPNAPNQPMFIVPQPPPMMQNNQFAMTTQTHHPNPPPQLPPLPYQQQEQKEVVEDPSQVKFMGPIPPPVKLPPKWKCAKDKYGRPYYYHVKLRKAQWEPPPHLLPLDEPQDSELMDSSSSSESSSVTSDSSTDSDDDDDLDDTKLLLEIRQKLNLKKSDSNAKSKAQTAKTQPAKELQEDEESTPLETPATTPQKRKREGLVQEIIISPRREEDRLQFKEDVKRYKETKEKLKRQKEIVIEQSRKIKGKPSKSSKNVKRHKSSSKSKAKVSIAPIDVNSEAGKRIKEIFRSSMASVMVGILNAYRKPDCKQGKITNTDDFKHLARKLTHFVMLKELKHCKDIQELVCTESVKAKAKEFVRKYMSKFGEVYIKPKDDLENY